jgi:hypothetical protein
MKWLAEIRHEFEPQGIRVSKTRGGHLRLDLPTGQPIFASSTPSDQRAIQNIRTQVKRALRPAPVPAHPAAPNEIEAQSGAPIVIVERPGEIEPVYCLGRQVVYHFTDTAHLPLILQDGELRPFHTALLWATTDPNGDRLSSTGYGQGLEDYRKGTMRRVRFTCEAQGFNADWRAGVVEHQGEQIAIGIEIAARRYQQSTGLWRWRLDPLPIERTLIETKAFHEQRWTAVEKFSLIHLDVAGYNGQAIKLGDMIYRSQAMSFGVCSWHPIPYSQLEILAALHRSADGGLGLTWLA